MINAADTLSETGDRGSGDHLKKISLKSWNREENLELFFSDNGPGIPEDELIRIFDPFYTTKEPGKGTGLGLSVSYRIIESLGGKIRAESLVGEGTTIIVTLPLYDGEEEESP
jgi:two-component system NtrC family sensor kinase